MIRAKREVSEGQHSIEVATLWKNYLKLSPMRKLLSCDAYYLKTR